MDKIQGLDTGADDYLVKPFGVMEMVSRIKAVLRRCAPEEIDELLRIGEIVLDDKKHAVSVSGEKVTLTYKEFELLRLFLSHPGRVYTREQLLEEVWGFDYFGDSRTVDVHVKRLREKINGVSENWSLETVWSVGYKFEVR